MLFSILLPKEVKQMALKRGVDWNRKHPLGGALVRLVAGIIIIVFGIIQSAPTAALIGVALTILSIYQIVKAIR